MPLYARDGGVWKPGGMPVKDGGVWKNPAQVYARDGGVWKPVFDLEPVIPELTFVGGAVGLANTNSYSIPVDLGAADSKRRIIAAIGVYGTSASTINNVTIAGVAAAVAFATPSSTARVGFYIAHIPSGTTGNVVFGSSQIMDVGKVAIYRLVTPFNEVPYDTARSTGGPISIDVPEGGFIIAAGQNGRTTSMTFASGIPSEDFQDNSQRSSIMGSLQSMSAQSGYGISVTNCDCLAAVSFGPA